MTGGGDRGKSRPGKNMSEVILGYAEFQGDPQGKMFHKQLQIKLEGQ